jgi:hypothetical protein
VPGKWKQAILDDWLEKHTWKPNNLFSPSHHAVLNGASNWKPLLLQKLGPVYFIPSLFVFVCTHRLISAAANARRTNLDYQRAAVCKVKICTCSGWKEMRSWRWKTYNHMSGFQFVFALVRYAFAFNCSSAGSNTNCTVLKGTSDFLKQRGGFRKWIGLQSKRSFDSYKSQLKMRNKRPCSFCSVWIFCNS